MSGTAQRSYIFQPFRALIYIESKNSSRELLFLLLGGFSLFGFQFFSSWPLGFLHPPEEVPDHRPLPGDLIHACVDSERQKGTKCCNLFVGNFPTWTLTVMLGTGSKAREAWAGILRVLNVVNFWKIFCGSTAAARNIKQSIYALEGIHGRRLDMAARACTRIRWHGWGDRKSVV